jgi:predicted AAA+ superfamily ATPase
MNRENDPLETLRRLNNILQAAHMRLIIFLEDLDRNASDEMIHDEMPALLDRLRHLENISFVLAIGTERQYSNVLVRICSHVESLT